MFLEALFQHFWVLVAGWLSGCFCKIILSFLGLGGQMALRMPLEAHFEHFWVLVARLLAGCFWRLMLSISRSWWPDGFQDAFGSSF